MIPAVHLEFVTAVNPHYCRDTGSNFCTPNLPPYRKLKRNLKKPRLAAAQPISELGRLNDWQNDLQRYECMTHWLTENTFSKTDKVTPPHPEQSSYCRISIVSGIEWLELGRKVSHKHRHFPTVFNQVSFMFTLKISTPLTTMEANQQQSYNQEDFTRLTSGLNSNRWPHCSRSPIASEYDILNTTRKKRVSEWVSKHESEWQSDNGMSVIGKQWWTPSEWQLGAD